VSDSTYSYRFIDSISHISDKQWNAITGNNYPFLRYEFLHALEDSGSVTEKIGWQPQHLIIENAEGKPVATLPLYIKSHSYGEYVFDWSWADAFQRHGLLYYPKLLSAIPFTPATGPRLSVDNAHNNADIMPVVYQALQDRSQAIGASGWHVLFPEPSELGYWESIDVDQRLGCQFHWKNNNYQSFDDFLASFSSRKRKDVKKERRRAIENDIHIKRLTGNEITLEHWQQFYHFYQITYAKKSGHGGYLTPEFFQRLHHNMQDQLLLVMAYEGETAIAGALNFYDSETLYGRYWGAAKDIDCLHFEVCFYQGIEFCIENKLKRFDPGAQGEHKISRGFIPTITHSYHRIHHPEFRHAIQDFLVNEAEHIQQYQQETSTQLPFRKQEQYSK